MQRWVLFFGIAIGLCVLAGLPAYGGAPPKKEADKVPRTDALGDPLPEGAVARLGSRRWRNPESPTAFSPDGKYLAAGGAVTTLFDATTGRPIRRFDAPANFVTFAPDSRTLITTTSGPSPVVHFWDVDTGKERRNFPIRGGTSYRIPSAAADNKRVAFYNLSYLDPNERSFVSIWDMDTGREIHKWLDLRGGSIYLSPDAKTFVLPSRTHYFVYDTASGKEKSRIPFPPDDTYGNAAETRFLAFTSDGLKLAGIGKAQIYLWETATGTVLRQFQVPKEDAACVAISANDRILTAGGRKGGIYVWDLVSGELLHAIAAGRRDLPVYLLTLSPDGKKLASQQHLCSWIALWDVATGEQLSFVTKPLTMVERVAFGADGKSMLSFPAGGPIHRWDFATGELRGRNAVKDDQHMSATFRGPAEGLRGGHELWCSMDGKNVVGMLYEGEWKIAQWNVGKPEPLRSFSIDASHLRRLALSPDRKLLAGLGRDEKSHSVVHVWELSSGQTLRRFQVPGELCVGLTFSGDGRTLITSQNTAGPDLKTILTFWETATARARRRITCDVPGVPSLALVCDDRLAAVAAKDAVLVFDLATGNALARFRGHDDDITCLAFSADRCHLATGSKDSSVLVWDLAGLGAKSCGIKLSDLELAGHWQELAWTDAEKAYQAMRRLSSAGNQAVDYLSQRLSVVPDVEQERIQEFIADLDSDSFSRRDRATKELIRLSRAAETPLRQVLEGDGSLELRRRAEVILLKLTELRTTPPPPATGKELQAIRAVEVLEKIGTPEARRLLARLAQGAAYARLTREAQGSLKRLDRTNARTENGHAEKGPQPRPRPSP